MKGEAELGGDVFAIGHGSASASEVATHLTTQTPESREPKVEPGTGICRQTDARLGIGYEISPGRIRDVLHSGCDAHAGCPV